MLFWLWAFIRDGETFLAHDATFNPYDRDRSWPLESQRLKYHVIATMGMMLRTLNRVKAMFPTLQTPCDQAAHLFEEGKDLRDMIEHADDYRAGRGRKPQQFVREMPHLLKSLPGDQPGTGDATGMIVDGGEHWFGGRLHLERALTEARTIQAVALTIPAPD